MKKILIPVCSLSFILLVSCSKTHNKESLVNQDAENKLHQEFSNGAQVSYASGQATLTFDRWDGEVQHFSFHLVKDANGNVKGTWESKSPGQNLRTHGILNCLTFLDEHTAYMTGVVTQKVGDVFPGEYEVGMPVWFKVRDNGEGNNSSADEFTDYYSLEGIECVNYEQASIHPIISGNIQVRR